VDAQPGQVTRVLARFDGSRGKYVLHGYKFVRGALRRPGPPGWCGHPLHDVAVDSGGAWMTRNHGGSRLGTSHSNECPDEDRCGKRRLRAAPNRRTGRHEGGLPGRRLPRFARGTDPLGEIERTLTVVLAAVAGVLMLPAGTNIGVYFAVYWDVWAVVYLALTCVLILSSSPKQTRRWACVQRGAKGGSPIGRGAEDERLAGISTPSIYLLADVATPYMPISSTATVANDGGLYEKCDRIGVRDA
jgi:hypothetical protein